jgi:hypothetical protein
MEDYNKVEKDKDGTFYYLNNKFYRLYGPAREWSNGDKFWYQNGKRHRIDGPAEEHANGNKYWWFEGKHIKCDSQEEFERYLKLKLFW